MSNYHKLLDRCRYSGILLMLIVTALPRDLLAFQGTLREGAQAARGGEQAGTEIFAQGGIFETITNFLLFLLGAVAVIMLIIGGFKYVISGGDSSKVESAKNTIIYAIVGIVVAFLAWAAVDFVITTLTEST